jgi:hypothetical protein
MAGKKFDNMGVGFVPGLVFPVLTFLIIGLVRYTGSFSQFLTHFHATGMLSKVVSLTALPNLLLFFVFIWTERNYSARGVIFATLLVALVMLILKFA